MNSTTILFNIHQWAAWAPGLQTVQQWQEWSTQPHIPEGDQIPDVSVVPPLQRRRMNRLTRMVFYVVNQIPQSNTLPQIYCSRHGDLQRSTDLLKQITEKEALSSTNFGLSVHNAVAGNLSILQKNSSPITSLASGDEGLPNAVIEAVAQSRKFSSPVLLVIYDETLPLIYATQTPSVISASFAFALLISSEAGFALNWRSGSTKTSDPAAIFKEKPHNLPFELGFLAWLIQGKKDCLTQNNARIQWVWRRHLQQNE